MGRGLKKRTEGTDRQNSVDFNIDFLHSNIVVKLIDPSLKLSTMRCSMKVVNGLKKKTFVGHCVAYLLSKNAV